MNVGSGVSTLLSKRELGKANSLLGRARGLVKQNRVALLDAPIENKSVGPCCPPASIEQYRDNVDLSGHIGSLGTITSAVCTHS
ncbi:hypothetical protein VNO80_10648 [Phaseolus coccineus]|uniref:Uncharacterized protein n=1 Tax=Phaseolus coccineus TaxID=3886 RepID=A0AAN9N8T1_PHACN